MRNAKANDRRLDLGNHQSQTRVRPMNIGGKPCPPNAARQVWAAVSRVGLTIAISTLVLGLWRDSEAKAAESPVPAEESWWVLEFRGVANVKKFGIAVNEGAYQLDIPAKGLFSARTISRLVQYPKKLGACEIVGSQGYEETVLNLEGLVLEDM